jgi:hypothetical protein
VALNGGRGMTNGRRPSIWTKVILLQQDFATGARLSIAITPKK